MNRLSPPLAARPRIKLLAAGILSLAAITSCSDSTAPLNCTDRGCYSGLLIRFDTPLADGTVVTLEIGETPWAVTCGGTVDCSESLFFEGLRAEYLSVRISTAAGARRHEVRPEYHESKPNGPDCPGECFHAEVALATAEGR